jgi:citronellol/citronellal dehydrogenase
VLGEFGALDVLVNNAGGQFVAPAEEISHNGFRAVMRLNLDAVWDLTREAALASMLPNGYGKVVSVVLSPRRGIPGMFHSSAARAAVESMTRTLATEWGGRGVRLTCVAPGTIDSEGWRGYGEAVEDVAATIPLGRLGTVGEVAQMIAFLVSPAGDFVTGTTVVIDGGVDNVDLPPGRRP